MLRASTAWPSRVRVRHSDLCEFFIITIIIFSGKMAMMDRLTQKKSKIPYMAQAGLCGGFARTSTLCVWRRFVMAAGKP